MVLCELLSNSGLLFKIAWFSPSLITIPKEVKCEESDQHLGRFLFYSRLFNDMKTNFSKFSIEKGIFKWKLITVRSDGITVVKQIT
jgi:hypothetical protein